MTGLRWVRFFLRDYLGDTLHLTAQQHGAYLLLLFHYYLHGGLPKQAGELAAIAKLTRHQWRRERGKVLAFFDPPDLRHKRCEAELARIKKSVKHPVKQHDGRILHSHLANSPMKSKTARRSKIQKERSSSKVTVCADDARRFLELCIAAEVDPKTIPDAPRGKTAKRTANGSTRARQYKPSTTHRRTSDEDRNQGVKP